MNRHSLQVLEFAEALELVARHASSSLGAEAVRALQPSVEVVWIETELRRVEEMATLLTREGGWPAPALPDLRSALGHLRVEGSVWEAPVLRDAATLLASSRVARAMLVPREAEFPLLAALAESLAALPRLEEAVQRAIDEEGRVRDEASPELLRLRRETRTIRNRIVERLASYMSSLPHQYQVSDASVTIREGRYVIPVRREGRNEVGGIVHDESGTGATLFIEPPVAIEMMNWLRELEAAEHREVLRILRELTERLRPHRPEMQAALEALVALDSILARARYALMVDGRRPALLVAGSTEYVMVQGRHPVLLARTEAVVPFDLRMDDGERTLLISGPNTGGKTVLLKAIGLISLLAQSGVVPPVGEGTRLPLFRDVFADIGDEQSIEASLSTFSAHLHNLREALAAAGPDSVVLIDEIGSGTDPLEGGALARAVLLELTRRSALTVATTHLGQLKLLATEEPGVVNASLQFDADRLQPTYRLAKGVPGRSYGLAIARRLGLPASILDEAERALPQGERDVGRLLLELEAKEQRLSTTTAELDAMLARTTALEERLESRERQLRQREKDAERRARQQARDLLLQSRREVDAAIEELRLAAAAADAARLDEAARSARRRVETAARQQQSRTPDRAASRPERGKPATPSPAAELSVGLRVRIESLGRTGTVVEIRDGRAMVETGGLRMLLGTDDLAPLPPGDQKVEPRPRARSAVGGSGYAAAADASSEVDLRGLRVDEIDMRLARALDSAIIAGLPTFRIIHGKGLGVLRDRVQSLLQGDPRIQNVRPGDRFEGGTGVTVVEFA
jgi:DNA mismatch repair protein MutS2